LCTFKVKNLVDVVSVRVSSVVHELHPTLLKELNGHVATMGSHGNLMLKKIVGCYTPLRVKCLIWKNYSYFNLWPLPSSRKSGKIVRPYFTGILKDVAGICTLEYVHYNHICICSHEKKPTAFCIFCGLRYSSDNLLSFDRHGLYFVRPL
jgi:hypothetical protein